MDESSPQTLAATKKQPGLWKKETSGDVAVCLSSKCYYVGERGTTAKAAHKGVQKRNFQEDIYSAYLSALLNLPFNPGEEIVYEPGIVYAENRGFRKKAGTIVTYRQKKRALSALYAKARICNMGIFCFYDDEQLAINFPNENFQWPQNGDVIKMNLP